MKEDKIKLLIVDDNKEFVNILSEYLEAKGSFEVVGKAYDGVEAVKLINNTYIDLVVLDLIMPKLDGIGVLEEINNVNLRHRPKIVILSAVGNDGFTQRALSLGAEYYMIKPIDIDIFAERMKELFSPYENTNVNNQVAATKELHKPVHIDIEVEISDFLHQLGIPAHIKGYMYLKEAITTAINDMTTLSGITKIIYPTIARKYNTTDTRVERAIRHAIEVSTMRSKSELWGKTFISSGISKKDKPTNGEFIGIVADTIRLRVKNNLYY